MEQIKIDHHQLRTRLNTGIVSFSFKKLGNNLRMAIGTTQLSKIPLRHHPKGISGSSPKVVPFYDLEKHAWRCVSITSLIWVSE